MRQQLAILLSFLPRAANSGQYEATFVSRSSSPRPTGDYPGMGPRTAEVVVAFLDDPHCFANGWQVSAYAGLVPAVPVSAP